MMFRSAIRHILVFLVCASGSASAGAATLLPGGGSLLSGTTLASDPNLAATPIEEQELQGFTGLPDPGNLFGVGFYVDNGVGSLSSDGNMQFSLRLSGPINTAVEHFYVDGFQLSGYQGFATDVVYRTDGPGDRGPTSVERSLDGDLLSFTFGFPLYVNWLTQGIHETSYAINIGTDARAYAPLGRLTVFGHTPDFPGETFSFSYSGLYVPVDVSEVPLPASLPLFLGGLGVMSLFRRQRRKGVAPAGM